MATRVMESLNQPVQHGGRLAFKIALIFGVSIAVLVGSSILTVLADSPQAGAKATSSSPMVSTSYDAEKPS